MSKLSNHASYIGLPPDIRQLESYQTDVQFVASTLRDGQKEKGGFGPAPLTLCSPGLPIGQCGIV
jgi:hypothetical protein